MNGRGPALVACVALAIVSIYRPPALGSPTTAAAAPDQLRGEAGELTDDAARAAASKTSIHVTNVVSLSQSSNADAGLARWLDSQIASINKEKRSRSQADDLRTLAGTLRRMASSAQPVAPPARAPRSIAQHVLASPDYDMTASSQAGTPRESLWERITSFLAKWLGKIFSGVFNAGTASPVVGQVVAILLVALLAVALAYLIVRIVEVLMARPRHARQDEGTLIADPIDPDALHQAGLAAAQAGHYAQAVALLFQASLAWFDRQGTFAFDPSLTPAEYRRAVRRTAERASPHFDELAQAFVMAAFAEHPVSRDDWAKADAAYAQMRAAPAA